MRWEGKAVPGRSRPRVGPAGTSSHPLSPRSLKKSLRTPSNWSTETTVEVAATVAADCLESTGVAARR